MPRATWRPPAGEAALLAALLLLAATATLSIAVSQAALALAIAAGLAGWLRGRRPPRTGVEWAALAFVLWCLLTLPFSQDPGESLRHAKRFLLLPALWLFAAAARDEKRRAAALIALGASSAAAGLIGLAQYLWGPGGLEGRADILQGYMTAGGLMMMVSLILLAFLVMPLRGRARLGIAACLLATLAGLAVTMTRSAWLGFAAGATLLLALAKPRALWLLAALLGAAVVLAPASYRDRLRSSFDPSHPHNVNRVVMWKTGLAMLRDHPLTGVGDLDLKALYRAYHPGENVEVKGHLHSNYAMFAALWGWPGLALALFWLVALAVALLAAWRRWRARRERAPPWAGGWILGALAAWAGFMVAGLFEWNFGDAEIALLLWSAAGLGLAPGDEPADGGADVANRARR